MKRFVISFTLTLLAWSIFGQRLGLSVGYCNNHFYDLENDDFHYYSRYVDGSGYTIGLNLDSVLLKRTILRLELYFHKNSGSIFTRGGGLGAGSMTMADVKKYCISLAMFPVHIKIVKNIKVNLGGEFNYLIKYNLTGTQSYWGPGSRQPVDLSEENLNLLNDVNFGLISRIEFTIKLKNQWYLIPEYRFYLGFSNEFKNVVFNVKSIRHGLSVGITNRFN